MRWTMYLTTMALIVLLATGSQEAAEKKSVVDQVAVNRLIDQGVDFLKQKQAKDGSWPYSLFRLSFNQRHTYYSDPYIFTDEGLTALAGFTLLECGVPAKDPAIQAAARYLRKRRAFLGRRAEPESVQRWMDDPYGPALSILFFDRLGDPQDKPLIPIVTRRLLAHTYDGFSGNTIPAGFQMLALWVAQRYGFQVDRPLAASARWFMGKDGQGRYADDIHDRWGDASSMVPDTETYMAVGAATLVLTLRDACANQAILRQHARTGKAVPWRALKAPEGDIALANLVDKLRPKRVDGSGRQLDPKWNWLTSLVMATLDETWGGENWYRQGVADILQWREQNKDSLRGQFDPGVPLDGPGLQGFDGQLFQIKDDCLLLLYLRRSNPIPEVKDLLKGHLPGAAKSQPAPAGAGQATHAGGELNAPPPPHKQRPDAVLSGLLAQLKASSEAEQDRLLQHWRDGEEDAYTPALAKAIPTLRGSAERKARSALADRCTRLTSHEREQYLRSDDVEIRRAAIFSCAVRDDKCHLARLVELLQDKELLVANAAHAVLCSLTGQDFGPDADAGQADRGRAVADWKNWHKKQANK